MYFEAAEPLGMNLPKKLCRIDCRKLKMRMRTLGMRTSNDATQGRSEPSKRSEVLKANVPEIPMYKCLLSTFKQMSPRSPEMSTDPRPSQWTNDYICMQYQHVHKHWRANGCRAGFSTVCSWPQCVVQRKFGLCKDNCGDVEVSYRVRKNTLWHNSMDRLSPSPGRSLRQL